MKFIEMIHCTTGSAMSVPEELVESYKAMGHTIKEQPASEEKPKRTRKTSTKK